jgi:hypothetical protein
LIGIRLLIGLFALTLFGQAPSVPQPKALVIGNAAYRNLPPVPVAGADARAIAQKLTGLGLAVTLLQDVEIDALATAVDAFVKSLQPAQPALVYYSGYAVQDKGENYLLPLGFVAGGADPVEFSAYSLKRLERFVEGKKPDPGLLLIDAAPLPPGLSRHFGEAGLALLDLRTPEMLLVFSSLPGQNAKDPGGRALSYFTQAWIEELEKPWTSLDAMSRSAKQRVSMLTAGAQSPAEMSTLVKNFAFRPRPPQEIAWEQLASSRDAEALRAFLQRYPGDPLAKLAATRLEEVEWAQLAPQSTAAALQQFLARYPGHPRATQALQALELAEQSSRKEAIAAVLQRYSKAYSEKNLDGVRALRPSLTQQELRTMEQSFRMAKSVELALTPRQDPEISGALATVPCDMRVEMRMDRNPPPPVKQQVVVTLSRGNNGWVIDTIR